MQQYLKVIISFGVTILVLGSCEWMLLSYVVKLLCLDKNKTKWVDVDLLLDILVFLRDPKYQHAAESKSDDCVGCNHACLRFLWVAPVVVCSSITMPEHE